MARVRYIVDDVDAAIGFYTGQLGFAVDNEIVTGRGVRQILLDDPAGNPVELFEPLPRET